MDSRTFDRLVAAAARPSRRGALRLLAAGLLGGLLAQRGSSSALAAQRADTDGDGLFDDDEANIYGTDPFSYDTDFDGVGDGEEIYYGTSPLVSDVVVVMEEPPPPGSVAIGDVGSGCVRVDANGNCVCFALGADGNCAIGVGDTWGDAAAGNGGVATCRGIGVACDYDTQCCTTGAVLCCWDGTSLQTECTDVTAYGRACPM